MHSTHHQGYEDHLFHHGAHEHHLTIPSHQHATHDHHHIPHLYQQHDVIHDHQIPHVIHHQHDGLHHNPIQVVQPVHINGPHHQTIVTEDAHELHHDDHTNIHHHHEPVPFHQFQKPILVQPHYSSSIKEHHVPEHITSVLAQPHEPIKVVQLHEISPNLSGLTKPSNPHDNHRHIQSILEKLRDGNSDDYLHDEKSNLKWHRRISKRSLFGAWTTTTETPEEYFPTVISHEDRFFAGCLLQCVFRRHHAVDKFGYPTLDGLTNLFTVGTAEQGFFIHVLRSVDICLKGASAKYHIYKGKTPLKGETCDVSFDVFDCVSDSITNYCSQI